MHLSKLGTIGNRNCIDFGVLLEVLIQSIKLEDSKTQVMDKAVLKSLTALKQIYQDESPQEYEKEKEQEKR